MAHCTCTCAHVVAGGRPNLAAATPNLAGARRLAHVPSRVRLPHRGPPATLHTGGRRVRHRLRARGVNSRRDPPTCATAAATVSPLG
eukprot:7388032-Prymnesium_polylepis.1